MKTLLLILCLTSSALAGSMRHDVSESKYLDFGKKFYCVKQLVTTTKEKDGTVYGFASCVILNKHWIITAGHIPEGRQVDSIKVLHNGNAYFIDKFIIHKDFDMKEHKCDIALGFCKQGFGDDITEPKLYKQKIKIGDTCSMAGFGFFGSMLTGIQSKDKILDDKIRGGSNIISDRRNDCVLVTGSKDHTKTSLEWLPNTGDSGGGLFVKGALAGITSCIIGMDGKADSSYGDKGSFTEIYPYLEWIQKHVVKTEM